MFDVFIYDWGYDGKAGDPFIDVQGDDKFQLGEPLNFGLFNDDGDVGLDGIPNTKDYGEGDGLWTKKFNWKPSPEKFVKGCGLTPGKILNRLELLVDGSGVLCCDMTHHQRDYGNVFDIGIEGVWKNLTKGKHLWLRNNFSTFTSQFIDTFTIVSLLIIFEILPSDKFLVLVISGFLFKVIVAILDTPLLYFFVWLFRKKFDLKVGEEIKMD